MKITKEQLKNIVRETLSEESEYQTFFKKALEKTGKSIPQMSDDEKKSFFNKIEKAWKGRGEKKNEGNAFGAAVAKAKKDGDDSFKVDGKEYKVEEGSINEISAKKGLEQVVKGNTKEVEGVKLSKEMAAAMLDWLERSPYGKKYPQAKNSRLHVTLGVMLNFGLERHAKFAGAKEEIKYLKGVRKKQRQKMKESSVNEGASTEEKRIAMLAVRKQAKYRNVDLATAIQDQIRALEDLQRDAKKGKIK